MLAEIIDAMKMKTFGILYLELIWNRIEVDDKIKITVNSIHDNTPKTTNPASIGR